MYAVVCSIVGTKYASSRFKYSDGIYSYIFLRQGSGKRTGEAVKRYDATFILPLLLFCNVKHVIRFIISCVCGFHSIILKDSNFDALFCMFSRNK